MALTDPVARSHALAQHLADLPADEPELAAVALRRASGTEHPAARRPDLVRAVAEVIAQDDPSWARSGRIDATVDRLLDLVAQMATLDVETD